MCEIDSRMTSVPNKKPVEAIAPSTGFLRLPRTNTRPAATSSHLWELGKTRSADALAGCRRALDELRDLETQLFERLAAGVASSC